jgi:hypothetical protein
MRVKVTTVAYQVTWPQKCHSRGQSSRPAALSLPNAHCCDIRPTDIQQVLSVPDCPNMSAGSSTSLSAGAQNGVLSPPPAQSDNSPRSSLDNAQPGRASVERNVAELEQELATVKQEKDVLGNQYRSLLGKLTTMRKSLGEKLREDAVCLVLTVD